MIKKLAIWGGAYLGMGVLTAATSVYLGSNSKPYFKGFGEKPGAVEGLLETVLVWPYALVVNLKG